MPTDELVTSVLTDISTDAAYRHLEHLVDSVGERVSSTPEIRRAAEYIRDQLKSYGLDARIDNFDMYHSIPGSASLRVVSPETVVIPAMPAGHIASTTPSGFEAELVFVNAGGYDDYEHIDVRGKVVLTAMDLAPRRPEKARIAADHGAAALIIMNWGPSDSNAIQMGATKSQWGNPTTQTFKTIPQLPVIAVSRSSGEYLARLCSSRTVKVWLQANSTREWVTAQQPVGILKAPVETEEFVLVGGHLDAWGKTAICNSSGNALILELARVLAQHRDKLRRNVVFAFWDGHEVAEAAGSTRFVDTNWDELNRHCIAYVNIDNPGIVGTSIPSPIGVRELKPLLQGLAQSVWGSAGDWVDLYKGGDASFFGVGVPYAGFYTRFDTAKLVEYNNAFLSPWLHTNQDTIDKIDAGLFTKHLEYFARLILTLCNEPIAPYDLDEIGKQLIDQLQQLSAISDEAAGAMRLDPLLDNARSLQNAIALLRRAAHLSVKAGASSVAEVGLANKAYLKITRKLSYILRSEADRYEQDPYGYTAVGTPVPRLRTLMVQYARSTPDGLERKLLGTELLKKRNEVNDALVEAAEYAHMAAAAILRKAASSEI